MKFFELNLQKSDIPKDLEQCRGVSQVVTALYDWANRCRSAGNIAGITLFLIGLIAGIYAADASSDEFMAFMVTWIPWAIYGAVAMLCAAFIRVLIMALATIVYNTTVTANIALKNAYDKLPEEEKKAYAVKSGKPIYHPVSKSVSKLEDAIYDQ